MSCLFEVKSLSEKRFYRAFDGTHWKWIPPFDLRDRYDSLLSWNMSWRRSLAPASRFAFPTGFITWVHLLLRLPRNNRENVRGENRNFAITRSRVARLDFSMWLYEIVYILTRLLFVLKFPHRCILNLWRKFRQLSYSCATKQSVSSSISLHRQFDPLWWAIRKFASKPAWNFDDSHGGHVSRKSSLLKLERVFTRS